VAQRLETYNAKRDFSRTREPPGSWQELAGDSFVIQKHAARRLHYDLRLELDGVMKSWAVARGPSLVPGDKRLAVEVEDHPIAYNNFEGIIPQGQYGGGTVMIWDRGRWIPEGDPHAAYAKGHLDFRLEGEKLSGRWHLVRMKRRARERRDNWLLIKQDDQWARTPGQPDILEQQGRSVVSGRTMDEIRDESDRVWPSRPAGASDPSTTRQAQSGKPAKPRPDRRLSDRRLSGAPPEFIAPCLSTLVETPPQNGEWLHEIKFDGYRLQARLENGRVELLTRNQLDWANRFPLIAAEIATLDAENALLDGEAVVEDDHGISRFSFLQEDLSERSSTRAIYYAFDLLHLDGKDLTRLPLTDRKAALAALLAKPPTHLRLSEHLGGKGVDMLRSACRLGLEGIVSKRADSTYRSGRGTVWVKSKCVARDEFLIAGYVPSTVDPKRIGSLIAAYHDKEGLRYAGRIGTGFTAGIATMLRQRLDDLRRKTAPFRERLASDLVRDVRWTRPELVAEVEYRGWTADGILRHAAFKGLRGDKEAGDVNPQRPLAVPKATAGTNNGASTVTGARITHPDRLMWTEEGITKQGLADYYATIAGSILPHIVDRPLSLVRCPSGAEGTCFFQKHAWAGLSQSIQQIELPGTTDKLLAIKDVAGLIGLVQAGVLEIHPWGSKLDAIDRPDRLTFDLDPGDGVSWTQIVEGAREVRERLSKIGLASFVKTSGGKGLHVVVPLLPTVDWDSAKAFARSIAEAMAHDRPARYVATMAKSARRNHIFIDYLRNGRGATAVAAYSSRARAGAPVSTPLDWDELGDGIRSDHFTVLNVPERLSHLDGDPWAEIATLRQELPSKTFRRRNAGTTRKNKKGDAT